MNNLNKLLLLAIGSILLSACSKEAEKNDKQELAKDSSVQVAADEIVFTNDQYTLADVKIGRIDTRNLNSVIKANGIVDVEPASVVIISAPLGGYVKTAGLLPGQPIKKGQLLATLDNPEFIDMQEQYLESSSRVRLLKQEFERQQLLRKQDVNAAKTLQQVTSDLEVMQAKVSALEAKIKMAGINKTALGEGKILPSGNLFSPITGYVRTSNINIGRYVTPTDVLFELAKNGELHIALNVFEKDIDQVQVGQTIRFGLGNETTMDRTATVFLIGKTTGENRMIPVHCHLTGYKGKGLLPGMYVKAAIEKSGEKVSVLPSEAIVQSEGRDYIFVQTAKDNGQYTFKMIAVKKGLQQDNFTEVLLPSTVSVDAEVVVKGAYEVLSALINSGEEE